jgi:transcriptional regulator with XRE-family HTH domain
MDRFGEKLRLLRTSRNITLNELSSLLGYRTHSYLSEIESGLKIPSAALILKVADLFNVTTDQLMRDELEINPQQKE